MTTFLKDEGEGERAIEEMSRAAYEYFSRLGASGRRASIAGPCSALTSCTRSWRQR